MKLYAVLIVGKSEGGKELVLAFQNDVSSLSFRQRRKTIERFKLIARELYYKKDSRKVEVIRESNMDFYCYYRSDSGNGSTKCVAICDESYPDRVAFNLCRGVQAKFHAEVNNEEWIH